MFLQLLSEATSNIDWLYWTMVFLWIGIIGITLYIEINTADITTIWFCLSAIVCFVLSLFGIYYLLQVVIFAVLSIVLVIATKPLTKKMMDKTLIRTNADKIISEVGVVTKKISSDEIGEVKVGHELWRAVSVDDSTIDVDEKVSILSFNGNKVVVTKINKNKNIDII